MLDYGPLEVTFIFADEAGNTANFTVLLNRVDAVPPVLTVISPENYTVHGIPVPWIKIRVYDATPVNIYISLNGELYPVYVNMSASGAGGREFMFPLEMWEDIKTRQLAVYIIAEDAYGNRAVKTIVLIMSDEKLRQGLDLYLFLILTPQQLAVFGAIAGISFAVTALYIRSGRTGRGNEL